MHGRNTHTNAACANPNADPTRTDAHSDPPCANPHSDSACTDPHPNAAACANPNTHRYPDPGSSGPGHQPLDPDAGPAR